MVVERMLGTCCALFLLVVTSSPARAQAVLRQLEGPYDYAWLGFSVAGVGDVDLDGYADVVAGAPHVFDQSFARVYSGRDGSLLHELLPAPPDPGFDDFGWSVDGLGDVDGDGHPDLVIGNHFVGSGAWGSARIYSG